MTQARIPFFQLAPANLQAMIALSGTVKKSSLGPRLVELINLRVSQINGCGVCVDMHWRDLIKQGRTAPPERDRRLARGAGIVLQRTRTRRAELGRSGQRPAPQTSWRRRFRFTEKPFQRQRNRRNELRHCGDPRLERDQRQPAQPDPGSATARDVII
jgi:AhpD family alkylhydroperoxidase